MWYMWCDVLCKKSFLCHKRYVAHQGDALKFSFGLGFLVVGQTCDVSQGDIHMKSKSNEGSMN